MRQEKLLLTFGAVILVQTITALLWAGGAAERLSSLETQLDQSQRLMERTARLEEQTEYIRDTLIRIEKKIDTARGE